MLYVCLFIITVLATYVVRRFSILDIPNQRSAHAIPTPRGGGLAFVALFYISIAWLWHTGSIQLSLFFALLGGLAVALVGFLDDINDVPAIWRALVHVGAS